jgi:4-carboxymuconolactone decarboxylase
MTTPAERNGPGAALPPAASLPESAVRRLAERGGAPAPLYSALAHSEPLLLAWIDFAWTLRSACASDRRVRELLILRSAQVHECAYQWRDHVAMAAAAGVPDVQVGDLADWDSSPHFTARERAALRFAEELFAGDVADDTWVELRRHFPDPECQELLMTAGFYSMVPRVVKALRLGADPETGRTNA